MNDIEHSGYQTGYHSQGHPLDVIFDIWDDIRGEYPEKNLDICPTRIHTLRNICNKVRNSSPCSSVNGQQLT
jgi:hypothetical protein